MKHNLQISVSDKPQRNSMVSCKNITLRERFLRMLFGRKQKITILVPSDSIEELAITKVKKGGSYEQNNRITEVIKNIGTLTESLQTVSNLLNEIKITEISKKSTVHTSESTGNSKVYSLEDVRGVLAKKSQSGLTSEVREIIVKYGGNKLSEIDPCHYEEIIKDAEALKNE